MPTIPCPMDVDADKDYLQYWEEIRHHFEYSLVHSSRAFAQLPSDDDQPQSSGAHGQPSYDLSNILLPPVGPSLLRLAT
ncbi:hypothetical protein PIB30_103098, partial [Stylosanthes scabra]|nr:hypothetical protein [Stylosanthes scabra]